jgi:hypothetical protein
VSAADVLVESVLFPPYTAVIECEPTDNPEVLSVAKPEEFTVPVPNVVAPSLNVTVPVGVPVAGATTLTVAVKVTGWPTNVGLGEETRAVELDAAPTVCVTVGEVLPERLLLPL